ncbi:MAG: helix-turn-helix transcriptional regulator [Gammaproteobacteria bacterium]|nr:helix-turn-helix transcriptional regulator [Gammaproteobacteria bacterium]MCY4166537.1 helix-turn-helix transcriptional regulator [Gammaproteobacteria bacterium]MCY4339799.1 helix-turn-helix transcriptional regulator [Gammaproteobacteria bacterium]
MKEIYDWVPWFTELADLRAYDEAAQRLAAGQDEMLPAQFAERILEGESAIRVWREFRRINAKELSRQVGISRAYLSQIENGSRAGALPTMKALAQALNLDLGDLA